MAARALHQTPPKAASNAFAAAIAAVQRDRSFEVWPDCWPAIDLYSRVMTQWRSSMGGLVGLDYAVVFQLLDRMGLNDTDWQDRLTDIQIIEAAVIDLMREDH